MITTPLFKHAPVSPGHWPRRLKHTAVIAAIVLITACGGGGGSGSGGGSNGDNSTVTEQGLAYQAVLADDAVAISADELLPRQFQAQSWRWHQSGGTAVAISDPGAPTLAFNSPAVEISETLKFELTATAANGDQQIAPLELAVVNPAQTRTVAAENYKLEQRPNSGSCKAPALPASNAPFALEQVFPGINVAGAADMDQAPGDDSHWYVTYIFDRQIHRFSTADSNAAMELVLDLSDSPGRVRSMAFHPDFASNGKIYVQVHNGTVLESPTTIREFTWSDALGAFDPTSERIILRVDSTQDEIEKGEHPGGNLNFGPDGYLYTALGDGTDPAFFNQNSQLTDNLWGSMLRLDVDNGDPYAIPIDNPFASGGGRPEIYAWGFRHPWKWTFDRLTGDIWLGDVGYVTREEIDRVVKGGNYGWPIREGLIQCPNCKHEQITVDVDSSDLLDPVVDYGRDSGRSVTGGYVYRGLQLPRLQGVYIFADYLSGNLFGVRDGGQGSNSPEVLLQTSLSIVTFAQDIDGELYALDFENGGVYQIVQNNPALDSDFPQLLSATGCVDMTNPQRIVPGMIPYTVQVPLWSDNAVKTRWMALPDGGQIDQIENSDGDFAFPVGTVLVKHFRLFNRMIETRLFVRHDNGQWAGYSYEWNDSESEATLLAEGKLKDIGGQQWQYPSGAECMQCHTQAAGWALGPTTRQFNTYQSAGEILYSQLGMLEAIDLFSFAPNHALEFAALENAETSLDQRARAYLDVNCAGCHRPNGEAGRSNMDLRVATTLAAMDICDAPPLVDSLGNPEARILKPGSPEESILYLRISNQGAYRMPPLGSSVVHPEGSQLIADWILSVRDCD